MIAEFMIAEEVLAGPLDTILSELPVQFDDLPPGTTPPPSSTWTPGTLSPLKRVTRHTDGAAAATVALVMCKDEAPFEVLHPDWVLLGRKEVSLDFGDASRSSARTWARRYLNVAAQAREGIQIELIPEIGPQPYRDFGIGDNISVLGELHRVAAIGMRLDASSVMQWTVDLDQPKMLLEERLAAIMRRQHPGSAGGRSVLPSRTDPSFPSNQAGTEQVHTWQWDGPLNEIQLYKNGVAITGGTLTVTAGNSEKVTLVDAARKYVKGVDKITFTAGGGLASPEWIPPDGRWLQEIRVTADAVTSAYTITVSVA